MITEETDPYCSVEKNPIESTTTDIPKITTTESSAMVKALSVALSALVFI